MNDGWQLIEGKGSRARSDANRMSVAHIEYPFISILGQGNGARFIQDPDDNPFRIQSRDPAFTFRCNPSVLGRLLKVRCDLFLMKTGH